MGRTEVIEFIRQVAVNTLPPNSNLLLYGSRARGDNHDGSDWDLLILLDKPTISFNDYSVGYPFRELGWEINEEINPQVYSKKEWNDYQFTPFYKNVESDKVLIL
jgi:predicted nucleotidyltransferase